MSSEIFADSRAHSKKHVFRYWSLFSSTEQYLKNVFNNIFLNKYTNSYPYGHKKLNTWFMVEVPPQNKKDTPVKMPFYNAENMNNARSAIKQKTTPTEHGNNVLEYWFHATVNQSAVNIVTKGIDLKKGYEKLDFSSGDGFYLNPDGMSAVDWVKTKADASVIIFGVSEQMISDHRLLDLRGDLESWKNVVKWNRSGYKSECKLVKELSEQFEQCDYIRGPMAGDKTKYIGPNWEPEKKGSQQICVKTKKMAKVIGHPKNVIGVVSWNN